MPYVMSNRTMRPPTADTIYTQIGVDDTKYLEMTMYGLADTTETVSLK